MDNSELVLILVAAVSAFLVGLSKGGLANVGMLSTPILAMVISPVKAAALLLPIFVVSDMVGLWSYRREFDRRNLAILIPAASLGIALGWATSAQLSERMVGLMIGVMGLLFSLNTWRLRHTTLPPRSADIPRGVCWGTIMGFTSFVSHTGGPPYQIYVLPQQLPKTIFAGTTTIAFAAINAIKVIPYWQLGQFNPANLKTASMLMPIAIVGTLIGVRLVRVMKPAMYFGFVNVALLLVSIKLIVDAL